jgi:pimeloyl-ACP methyl ester carboxylesterase
METLTHEGRRVAYRQTDTGEAPILYVHGAGGDHRVWTHQCGPDGVGSAVAVDLPGHGASAAATGAPGRETLDAYATAVVAVAAETGARTVVGNSMGGAVVLWATLEHDLEPDALVLCGTGAKLSVGDDLLSLLETDFTAAVEALSAPNLLFHDPTQAPLQTATTAMHETGQPVTLQDFRTCDRFDVRPRLDAITTPTLALTGEHDGMTPPAFTEYLGEHLSACTTALLDDCAHLSMLERPAAWNTRVGQFLAGT